MLINSYGCWLFDMDGTLTVPTHDFETVRVELGIPQGEFILEYLDRLPAVESAPMHERLKEIEWQHAHNAMADPAAEPLLSSLSARGLSLGVVTRNSADIAHETLRVCGLQKYFTAGSVIAREDARPKPEADGINLALRRLNANSDNAVMVGDFVHDLAAGRAAGTETIWIDHAGDDRFRDHADYVFGSLGAVLDADVQRN